MAIGQQFYGNPAANPHDPKEALPKLSYALDAVRAYQFEVHFDGLPPNIEGVTQNGLTLAAKQVSQASMAVEDIEVHRANDKLFYPGKVSQEDITITFDNLISKEGDAFAAMWQWFKRGYDPVTGKAMTDVDGTDLGGSNQFKAKKVSIVLLKGNLDHVKAVELFGVYPKAWKTAEFNYAQNEFNTLEVTFRFDYMDAFSQPSVLQGLA